MGYHHLVFKLCLGEIDVLENHSQGSAAIGDVGQIGHIYGTRVIGTVVFGADHFLAHHLVAEEKLGAQC